MLALVGADELVIALALALIARGMWEAWRPGAWLVPGIVLLYIVLPPRVPFLTQRPDHKRRAD